MLRNTQNIVIYQINQYCTCAPIKPPYAKTRNFMARENMPLAQKYVAGSKKTAPMARPHILCQYSMYHIRLKSDNVISLFFLKKIKVNNKNAESFTHSQLFDVS